MIEFRTLTDDHPDLASSPLLRAALLTLRFAQEHGAIGLDLHRFRSGQVLMLGGLSFEGHG